MVSGGEAPQRLAGVAAGGIKGIECVITGADVNHTTSYRRRGADPVSGGEAPQGLAGVAAEGIKGIELVVIRADVDHAASYCRRGVDVVSGGEAPQGLASVAAGGIKDIELVISRANIDHAIGNRWRGPDLVLGGKAPQRLEPGNISRTNRMLIRIVTSMSGIKAKHRLMRWRRNHKPEVVVKSSPAKRDEEY